MNNINSMVIYKNIYRQLVRQSGDLINATVIDKTDTQIGIAINNQISQLFYNQVRDNLKKDLINNHNK